MTREEVNLFLKFQAKLKITYEEIGALSKKSPNDAVNKFKLKHINDMLAEANKLLKDDYAPFKDFNVFNEDDVTTNSDVVFIISPYLEALEKLRVDNIQYEGDFIGSSRSWRWTIDGKMSDMETNHPRIR